MEHKDIREFQNILSNCINQLNNLLKMKAQIKQPHCLDLEVGKVYEDNEGERYLLLYSKNNKNCKELFYVYRFRDAFIYEFYGNGLFAEPNESLISALNPPQLMRLSDNQHHNIKLAKEI